MSKSINDLLSKLNTEAKIEPASGKLYNPDIPTQVLDDTRNVKDQYFSTVRMSSQPRSGTYSLPRQAIYKDPRKEAFLQDDAIDPSIIRSMVDPDSAMPSLSSSSKFSLMPESVQPPHTQVGLIRKSHESEINFRNRYKPQEQAQQPLTEAQLVKHLQPLMHGTGDARPKTFMTGPGF